MSAIRKFLFDTSFDPDNPGPATAAPAAEPVEEEPPAPTFGEAELEAARQEAFNAGRENGVAESLAGLEQQIASALQSALADIRTLLADQAAAAETRRAVAMRLSLKAIETLFPTLSQSTTMDEVESAIGSILRQVEDEPRVVIRVAETLAEPLSERLSAISTDAGFQGQLVLLPDGTLAPGAVRVEWASGGAERDNVQLWQDLRATVEAHLAGLPEIPQADGAAPQGLQDDPVPASDAPPA